MAHQQRRTAGEAPVRRPPEPITPLHHLFSSSFVLLPVPTLGLRPPALDTNVHQLRPRCRAGALSSAPRGTCKVGQSQHPSVIRRHPFSTGHRNRHKERKTSRRIVSGGLGPFSLESPRPRVPPARLSVRRRRRTAGEGPVGSTPVSRGAAHTTRRPGVHLPHVRSRTHRGLRPSPHAFPRLRAEARGSGDAWRIWAEVNRVGNGC